MAVTSIWRVNGWLGKVMLYAENPEKTINPAFYENQQMNRKQLQELEDVIGYAMNSEKTQGIQEENTQMIERYVSGIHCYPETAREEMMAVKQRFGKKDGTVAYHGYQSFAPGEGTPSLAHQIGVELASRLWGDRYQVIVATHLDKENHLHNHFVVNTVSFVDGIKYHRTRKDYQEMRKISDELCRKYQLSVIMDPQTGRTKQYEEWQAEIKKDVTWRGIIRSDVDDAIGQSMTERQFFEVLRKKGYEIKTGADISVRPPGKERFVRLARNFGEGYAPEGIRRRILSQSERKVPVQEMYRTRKRRKCKNVHRGTRKVIGFRALYIHYSYLLGYFPKKQTSHKRMHFLLKEDLRKMDAISKELQLLVRYHIDTDEQLSDYQGKCRGEISILIEKRKELYRKVRSVSVSQDEQLTAEVKKEIAGISKELAALRKEVKLCEDIAVRSEIMKEKIKAVKQDQSAKRKELEKNEQWRRCGRTDR